MTAQTALRAALCSAARHRQPKEPATNDEEDIEENKASSASKRGKKRTTREVEDIEKDELLALLQRSEWRREQRAEDEIQQIDKRFEEQHQAWVASERAREERQDRKDEMLMSVLAGIARNLQERRPSSA